MNQCDLMDGMIPNRERGFALLTALLVLLPLLSARGAPVRGRDLSAVDKAKIKALCESYRSAWIANDQNAVLKTLTENAVLLPQVGRSAIVKFWWPADAPPTIVTDFTMTTDEISGSGDVGYVWGKFSLAFNYEEKGQKKSSSNAETYLMIVRLQASGSWLITRRMWDAAATIFAVTPGPGIFYVLTRSLKGGRREGMTSAFGTAIGGIGHVAGVALGLSTLLATSAVAFRVVKYAGAAYLIFLGLRTLLSSDEVKETVSPERSSARVFYQGFMNEALNPKTPLFFLAFIPQFINPNHMFILQFMLLGCISVLLNLSADVGVAVVAGPIGKRLKENVRLRRGQRIFSGCSLVGLGIYAAVAGEKR